MVGPMGKSSRRAATLAGALAALVTAGLPLPAEAQFFFWNRGPRYSADDVARMAIQRGYRPLMKPYRSDDVYVADVLDGRGRRERLIVNSDSGEILQRLYLDNGRGYRRYADPSLPSGPRPPGRIPGDDRGALARLSPDDDDRPMDLGATAEPRQKPAKPRRQRAASQAPETVRQTPVESAPLAPPTTAPPALRSPAPASPAPTQAALPPAAATPAPPASAAPADKPVRSISRDPLAIPGSREHDAEQAAINRGRPAGGTAPKDGAKPAAAKPMVPVAPLE